MLADLCLLAEKNIYSDPNTTIIKLGMFGEFMVQYMFAYDNLEVPNESTHANRMSKSA